MAVRQAGAVGAEGAVGDDVGDDAVVDDTVVNDALVGGFDDDPFADDLDERLRERAPLPITRTTVVLAGLVLVVGGFLGGVLTQQKFGSVAAPTSAATGPAFGGRNAGAGGAGPGGGLGGGGGAGVTGAPATIGKVTLVDGSTLYVTTASGEVVIIHTSATTSVTSQQTVAVKGIATGDTVTVVGSTGADGSVNATAVTARR